VLTTNQKGTIAELRIAAEATALGIDVYRPVGEGGRYDLIFGVADRLLRVQCKWASRHGEVITFHAFSSRRSRAGLVRRYYDATEIDAFAAYCAEVDSCYLVPFESVGPLAEIRLRLAPAKNNQQAGIRFASDFEFGATLPQTKLGPIAQLGERVHGMHEVAGSSPAGSTDSEAA
jgi:hypothetical protein